MKLLIRIFFLSVFLFITNNSLQPATVAQTTDCTLAPSTTNVKAKEEFSVKISLPSGGEGGIRDTDLRWVIEARAEDGVLVPVGERVGKINPNLVVGVSIPNPGTYTFKATGFLGTSEVAACSLLSSITVSGDGSTPSQPNCWWFDSATKTCRNACPETGGQYPTEEACQSAAGNLATQTVGDSESKIEVLIKPLQTHRDSDGKTAEEKQYSPDPYDLERVNEDDTRRVYIIFAGLKPNTDYFICLDNAEPGAFCPSKKKKATQEGKIEFYACGNGPSALKLDNDCKNLDKIYFHGGHTYSARLYDKGFGSTKEEIGSSGVVAPLAEAKFYVSHYFPNVYINKKLVATTDPNKQEEANKAKNDKGDIIIYENAGARLPLTIHVTGSRPGGVKRNNYEILLENTAGKYKKDRCMRVNGHGLDPDGAKNNPIITFGNQEYGDDDFLFPGRYLLKINEQVNDNQPIGITKAFGNCSGGFTYWYITLDIQKGKDNKYTVKVVSVAKDPNRSDARKFDRYKFGAGKLPCVGRDGKPVNTDESGTCEFMNIPLVGTISTRPELFITDLFQFALSIAGVAIIFIFVLNGYRLLTSAGDKQKVADARDRITSAIIGLLFIIFSFVILEIISHDFLKIPGF